MGRDWYLDVFLSTLPFLFHLHLVMTLTRVFLLTLLYHFHLHFTMALVIPLAFQSHGVHPLTFQTHDVLLLICGIHAIPQNAMVKIHHFYQY